MMAMNESANKVIISIRVARATAAALDAIRGTTGYSQHGYLSRPATRSSVAAELLASHPKVTAAAKAKPTAKKKAKK